MKKSIVILVLCLVMMSVLLSTVAFARNDIEVLLDGEYVEFDVKPQIINGRTMVPFRAIFEALGAEVEWNEAFRSVRAVKDGILVEATIGSTKMYVDNDERIMDVAPMIIDGRTLVPVRFIAEAFNCDVYWEEDRSTVHIESFDEVLSMNEYNSLTEEELYEMNE